MAEAILFVWYPGQEGGRAVASLLFGDASPSGKLTVTFPKATTDLPPFEEYSMTGRTYRYATIDPLFPFGFGLSYASFEYQDLKIIPPSAPTTGFRVAVKLKNTGSVVADEVVQLYLSAIECRLPAPLSQLIAFQRVSFKPGQTKTVHFDVTPGMLMLFDEDGRQVLEGGKFRLTAGGCSPSARGAALGAPQPVSQEFTIS